MIKKFHFEWAKTMNRQIKLLICLMLTVSVIHCVGCHGKYVVVDGKPYR